MADKRKIEKQIKVKVKKIYNLPLVEVLENIFLYEIWKCAESIQNMELLGQIKHVFIH